MGSRGEGTLLEEALDELRVLRVERAAWSSRRLPLRLEARLASSALASTLAAPHATATSGEDAPPSYVHEEDGRELDEPRRR